MGWFSPSWFYRRPITIVNTGNTSSLTDYQVLVTVDTASLISAGKMRSDGGDIRFTDGDGTTLISYWIESGINTTSTRIWVKVPSIPGSSTKTIYMYYGNPSATSTSNGDNVFLIFDDFLGTSLNTSKWSTTISGSGSVSVGNGVVTIQSGTTNYSYAGIISVNSITPPIIIETRATTLYTGDWSVIVFFGNAVQKDSGSQGYWWGFNHPAGGGYLRIGGMNGTTIGSLAFSISSPLKWQMHVFSSGEKGLYNDSVKVSGSDTSYTGSSLKVGLQAQTGNAANSGASYDWILVRKYTSPEPSSSVGSEEVIPTIISEAISISDLRRFDIIKEAIISPLTMIEGLEVHLNKEVVRPSIVLDEYLSLVPEKALFEPITLTDYLSIPVAPPGVKYLYDDILFTDYLSKFTVKTPFIEAFSMFDAFEKTPNLIKQETISIEDIIFKSFYKWISEEKYFIDELKKDVSKFALDAFTVSDIYSLSVTKTISEYLTFLDLLSKNITYARTWIEDVSLLDVLATITQFSRINIESIILEPYLSLMPQKVLLDEASILDVLSKFAYKPLSDQFAILDFYSGISSFQRTYLESIFLVDYFEKVLSKRQIETLTFIDRLVKDIIKPYSEAITVYDLFEKIAVFKRAWLDAFIFSEITTTLKPIFVLKEFITILDVLTKSPAKRLEDTFTLIDYLRYFPSKYLSETFRLLDEFKRQVQFMLSLSEYVGLRPIELVYIPELGIWVYIIDKKEIGVIIG